MCGDNIYKNYSKHKTNFYASPTFSTQTCYIKSCFNIQIYNISKMILHGQNCLAGY